MMPVATDTVKRIKAALHGNTEVAVRSLVMYDCIPFAFIAHYIQHGSVKLSSYNFLSALASSAKNLNTIQVQGIYGFKQAVLPGKPATGPKRRRCSLQPPRLKRQRLYRE